MKSFLFLIAAISSLAVMPAAGGDGTFRPVGPGVWHAAYQVTTGPLNYNVLQVDVSDPRTTLEAEPAMNRMFMGETVAAAARREAEPGRTVIVGGINGDFWAMTPKRYLPVGSLVSDGWIHRMGSSRRSAFAITRDEKIHIGPISFTIRIKAGEQTFSVDSVNVPSSDRVVLFTPPYGPEIPPTTSTRFLLKLSVPEFLPNQPVRAMASRISTTESMPTPQDSLVLALPANSQFIKVMEQAREVSIEARVPEVDGVVVSCLGGGPRIVHQGKVDIDIKAEGVGASFVTTKHPRTAVGVTRDGQTAFLVTVDGRQPKISVGKDLNDLGEFMRSLGCWEAMNLDGGGSTTMVVGDRVVNKPSDAKGPRPVSNALLVVASASSGKAHSLKVEPVGDPLIVPVGTNVRLTVKAFDEHMDEIPLLPGAFLQAEATGGLTAIASQGNLVTIQAPETSTEGKVTITAGEARTEILVRSTKLDSVTIRPPVLLLDPGEMVSLDIVVGATKSAVTLQPHMVHTKADNDILSVTQTMVEAVGPGESLLHIRIGSAIEAVPVYVGPARTALIESFDSPQRIGILAGTNFRNAVTKVTPESREVKEGSGATRLDYAMSTGGPSVIAVPVQKKLTEPPLKFSIWIKGDGKEAGLRSTMVDSTGTTYTADFTGGGKGIYWKDEWRRASLWLHELVPAGEGTRNPPQFPLTIEHLYLHQEKDALKTPGSIILDGFEALYSPITVAPQ